MTAPPMSPVPADSRRVTALALTVALHIVLAALFLMRHSYRPAEVMGQWIDVVQVPPARTDSAPAPQAALRKPRAPAAIRLRPGPAAPAAPVPAPAPATASEQPFAETAPAQPNTFELARAAAGNADKELRKQFPERKLIRTVPRTDQQKLAEGIASAIAPPKFYEPARITKVQDQGGWGRRIEKVQTAFGTYCATYESNHGGDGRDVFTNALQPKLRTCPREE